jgi:hypothetical protein
MSPREERRFRLVWLFMVPYSLLVAVVASLDDWSVGWIWLAVFLFVAAAAVFVHRRPGDGRRRR